MQIEKAGKGQGQVAPVRKHQTEWLITFTVCMYFAKGTIITSI